LLTVFISRRFYLEYKIKLMRTILHLTIVVVLFSSCSKFQYYSLAADNLSKNKKQEFIAENDTCRITYNFYGEKGPIHISIYNKTNKPLQVDWKKSAVIFGDDAIKLFTKAIILQSVRRSHLLNPYNLFLPRLPYLIKTCSYSQNLIRTLLLKAGGRQ